MSEGLTLNVDKVVWILIGIGMTWMIYSMLFSYAVGFYPKLKEYESITRKTIWRLWGIVIVILLVSGLFRHDNKQADVGAQTTLNEATKYVPPSKEEIGGINNEIVKKKEQERKAQEEDDFNKSNDEWNKIIKGE